MCEGSMEQPDDGYEEEQNGEEHEGDVAAGGGFLAGFGACDAEGVDEGVDYEAEWIHGLVLLPWLVLLVHGCFSLCSHCSMLRSV
jgi:hypothetical protein